MTPHIVGIIPYATAWYIIIQNFNDQVDDLCKELKELMPAFVKYIIYGSVAIFSSFTFVQMRYQWLAPKYYWRTELWYCFLSVSVHVRPSENV